MINTKTKLFIATVHLILSGCVTYYPQVVDIPLIKEKGDVRIDAGAFLIPNINGSNDDSEPIEDAGIHSTFTVGITNLLAVQTYLSIDALFRLHMQGALGLYNKFENNTVIEMYSGFGYGNGYMRMFSDFEDDDYYLVFTQCNFGKTNMGTKHFDYGIGLKGGYLFTNIPNNSLETIYKKNGWMIEPTIAFRFGGSRAKFSTKINYMWTNTVIDEYYYPVSVSFGVNFHAGNRRK